MSTEWDAGLLLPPPFVTLLREQPGALRGGLLRATHQEENQKSQPGGLRAVSETHGHNVLVRSAAGGKAKAAWTGNIRHAQALHRANFELWWWRQLRSGSVRCFIGWRWFSPKSQMF